MSTKINKTIKRWKDQGLCPTCGNDIDGDGYRCSKCASKHREYEKKRREEQRVRNEARGACIQCGAQKDRKDRKKCATCRAKDLKKAHRYLYGDGNREKVLKRDSGKCQCCHKNGVVIHHIDGSGKQGKMSWVKDHKPNNSLDNLILLCRKCHLDIHKLGSRATRQIAFILLAHRSICTKKRKTAIKKGWKKVRTKVLKGDGYACVLCNAKESLVIHHKDDCGLLSDKPNNNLDNLTTLCRSCHSSLTNLRNNGDIKIAGYLVTMLGPGARGISLRELRHKESESAGSKR